MSASGRKSRDILGPRQGESWAVSGLWPTVRENGDLFPTSHCPDSPVRCCAAPGLRGGRRWSESRRSVPRQALSGRLRDSHPGLFQKRGIRPACWDLQ